MKTLANLIFAALAFMGTQALADVPCDVQIKTHVRCHNNTGTFEMTVAEATEVDPANTKRYQTFCQEQYLGLKASGQAFAIRDRENIEHTFSASSYSVTDQGDTYRIENTKIADIYGDAVLGAFDLPKGKGKTAIFLMPVSFVGGRQTDVAMLCVAQ